MNLENFPENKTARKMLNTVTKGWYDNSYVGKWLFEVMGQEMEDAEEIIKSLPLQVFPETATWGIIYHEILYGIPINPEKSLEERRTAVIRKRCMRAPLNPDRLEEWIYLTTGVQVRIIENVKPYTFRVQFEEMDFAYSLSKLFQEIRNVKPSHLSFQYGFGIIVENRNAVFLDRITYRFNMPWVFWGHYLDGSFLLDGNVLLDFCPEFNPARLTVRLPVETKEDFDIGITEYRNWWTLDGAYCLDGIQQMNAEMRKEVV